MHADTCNGSRPMNADTPPREGTPLTVRPGRAPADGATRPAHARTVHLRDGPVC